MDRVTPDGGDGAVCHAEKAPPHQAEQTRPERLYPLQCHTHHHSKKPSLATAKTARAQRAPGRARPGVGNVKARGADSKGAVGGFSAWRGPKL